MAPERCCSAAYSCQRATEPATHRAHGPLASCVSPSVDGQRAPVVRARYAIGLAVWVSQFDLSGTGTTAIGSVRVRRRPASVAPRGGCAQRIPARRASRAAAHVSRARGTSPGASAIAHRAPLRRAWWWIHLGLGPDAGHGVGRCGRADPGDRRGASWRASCAWHRHKRQCGSGRMDRWRGLSLPASVSRPSVRAGITPVAADRVATVRCAVEVLVGHFAAELVR